VTINKPSTLPSVAIPQLHPTTIRNESFGGVTYHLEGELVPVLHIEITSMPVYFEHHVLLWKHPTVSVGVKSLGGAFKRLISGMPIFMTEAKGAGHIAFSRDGAGQIIPLHLGRGQVIDVREHQFLAATDSVDFTFQRVQGIGNILFGQSGLFIDTFGARNGDGIVWLHGYGNVFEVTLQPGEQIDVEPGGWIYKDPSVHMELETQSLATGFFASGGQIFFNRFTGPGRVGIQSMYYHPPVATSESNTQAAVGGGILGAVMRGVMDNR
jgi:uncharacterized protein (AIM24 family)